MTQEDKNRLFTQLLSEYRELLADMDELNRALWFAANEENELMSLIVESGKVLMRRWNATRPSYWPSLLRWSPYRVH